MRQALDRHLNEYKGRSTQRTVFTRDPKAAERNGRERIRAVLEVLNFFVDLEAGDRAGVYIPGDARSAAVASLTYDPIPGLPRSFRQMVFSRQGLFVSASLKRVRAHRHFRSATRLLRKKPTPVESRLLMALRWCGRAALEQNPAHRILFYVFSLEALYAGPQPSGDISYRIGARAAHFLARQGRPRRLAIAAQVKELYGLRSTSPTGASSTRLLRYTFETLGSWPCVQYWPC